MVKPGIQEVEELEGRLVVFVLGLGMLSEIMDYKKVEITTVSRFITARTTDSGCRAAFPSVGKPYIRFCFDSYWVLFLVFYSDGAPPRVLPVTLGLRFVHLCNYSVLAFHPGEFRISDFMWNFLYQPHMANDVYVTVCDCISYAQNRARRRKRHLKLIFPGNVFKYVGMDIIRPLLKTREGTQFFVVGTHR